MRPRLLRWLASGSAALALSGGTGDAVAEPCTDEPRVCGRRAFDEGVRAFKEKQFAAAHERFAAAYAIQQHPIVAFNLALAEIETGRLLAALGHLEQLVADPSAGQDLVEKAREEIDRATALVGKITVDVPGAAAITVEIDGAPSSPVDGVHRVDPGEYAVKVVADGKVAIERRVQVSRGERVTLTLGAAPTAEPPAASVAAPADDPPAVRGPSDAGGLSPAFFYVAAGVTVAFGGVTVWSGLDTNAARSEFDERAKSSSRAEQQRLLDDGHSRETRTNVLLGATAVCAVATAALGVFAVRWGGAGESAALSAGPGSLAVGGRF